MVLSPVAEPPVYAFEGRPDRGRLAGATVTLATILCPIDRSPVSRRAFDYAVSLARWAGARLTVLEVIDVTPPLGWATNPELLLVPEEIRKGVRRELGELIGPALAVGVEVDARLEEGAVAERILETARAISADLVVMGTHGRSGVERLVLGSVAERIVRRAECPVLTVPPGADQLAVGQAPFRTVLCPTDFSGASAAAVALASEIAGRAGARLLLLNVVEWPFGHTTGPDPVTALRESLVADAGRQLAAALPAASGGPIVEPLALVGHPAGRIIDVARDRSVDLVVMGVSGRGAVNLAVLGSTAHRVLREACCPVITLRDAAGAGPAVPAP